VQHIAREKKHLTGLKPMTLAFARDVNLAFDALNGDFTGHLVGRQEFSRLENEAHDFKLLRLE